MYFPGIDLSNFIDLLLFFVSENFSKLLINNVTFWFCLDLTHLAREKALADAQFYKANREADSNKVS